MDEQSLIYYDRKASYYSKAGIVLWLLAGWIYAYLTWHLFWLPGILIFFPGIFIASLVSAIFFIPSERLTRRIADDWNNRGSKRWVLLSIVTVIKCAGSLAPLAGAILYAHLLQVFMK